MAVTEFLNVDLDLSTEGDIEELLRYLGPSMLVMNQTANKLSIELRESHSTVDQTITNLAELISQLPAEGKEMWNRCDLRAFNVGIQAGDEPHQQYFTISSRAVAMLASIGSEVTFTVYVSAKP
ncbi:MAG: hypothetical protein WBE69_19815 [Candidatus Binataceae bacterium]